ncbi:hypothetical protein PGT21_000637 [Puccinia graminis f. sp. tritici]|nr:hypothetical protein PGT21_000637 [Puccinia graminis f. sp. tritici]
MDVRRQLDERERARNKWKRKKVRTKKPKSPPILPRNPTTSEIEHAASVVNRDFKLYDHGVGLLGRIDTVNNGNCGAYG